MFRLICLVIGYAIGCIQTAYYVSKWFGKIDIREHGSGNAGTTNVMRTLGAKAGIVTFFMDIFKTIAAFMICSFLFQGESMFYTFGEGMSSLPGLYGALGAILGHNFPIQLKWKGGKGIACTLTMMLCLDLKLALLTYAVGMVLFLTTQYISLASLVMCVLFVVFLIIFNYELEILLIGALVAGMAIYRHRANIKRLLKGEERKFSIKRNK